VDDRFLAVATSAHPKGTGWSALLFVGIVGLAFWLGRRKGRNAAVAKAEAVAMAAGGESVASGGDAGASAGVVVQLHLAPGVDVGEQLRDAMRIVGAGTGHDDYDRSLYGSPADALRSVDGRNGSAVPVLRDHDGGVSRLPAVVSRRAPGVGLDGA
jgi:hypothetical protein